MRLLVIGSVGLLGVASVLGVACGSDASCGDLHTCGGGDDASAEGSALDGPGALEDGNGLVEGGGGDAAIDAPAGCDLSKDPKDSLPCVDESVGVFVDASSGSDSNPGTKAKPFKSIGKALTVNAGKKPRVYVCAGVYPESVTIDQAHAASIYGQFDCSTWGTTMPASPTQVQPTSGYALHIDAVTSALGIQDIEFDAPAGTDVDVSSIAAFVDGSPSVTLKRVLLKAQAAHDGTNQTQGATGALQTSTPTAGTQNGNAGTVTNGGAAQSCTCSNGGTSKGGKGGDLNGDGASGDVSQVTSSPVGHTGAGGTFMDCSGTSTGGRAGSDAPSESPASSISTIGVLTSSGWVPQPGKNGTDGQAGQGGGGGGGYMGGGGSGGCGSCGGSKGLGGGGGGASASLLVIDSPVTLVSCTLQSSTAGNGGAGGAGGAAQVTPGARGNGGGVGGCGGGVGGLGGAGGAGGGGAGGISAAILYKGTKPSYGADTMLDTTKGALGTKGTGGVPGTNDGIDGIKGDAVAAP